MNSLELRSGESESKLTRKITSTYAIMEESNTEPQFYSFPSLFKLICGYSYPD